MPVDCETAIENYGTMVPLRDNHIEYMASLKNMRPMFSREYHLTVLCSICPEQKTDSGKALHHGAPVAVRVRSSTVGAGR